LTHSSALLAVHDISKQFSGFRALQNVSLSLQAGERLALIGPNGAGKTTLFNLISGRLRADTGDIVYRGRPIQKLRPSAISRLGIARTFQITSIYPDLTALQNVQVALFVRRGRSWRIVRSADGTDAEEAATFLDVVGLRPLAARPSRSLSYGDQKKLELAIALSMRPQLLLLDEPTAGMAVEERHEIVDLVRRLCIEQRLTLLFCEHDLESVFSIADRITVLHQGRILAEGAPEEIRGNDEIRAVYLGSKHRSGI